MHDSERYKYLDGKFKRWSMSECEWPSFNLLPYFMAMFVIFEFISRIFFYIFIYQFLQKFQDDLGLA